MHNTPTPTPAPNPAPNPAPAVQQAPAIPSPIPPAPGPQGAQGAHTATAAGAAPKTFLLGVGAQKAGTTWMYDYLSRHPGTAMGRIKEYAVFGGADPAGLLQGRCRARLRDLRAEAGDWLQALKQNAADPAGTSAGGTELPDPAALLDLMDMLALELDPGRAPLHFDRLLAQAPGAHVTGDITPAYSGLPAQDFARIRALMEGGGYQVKVVFLLRDPVERCWSALRMHDRNLANAGRSPKRPAHERFATEGRADWNTARTRYDHTLAALEAVFAPGDIFCALYEEFISEAGVRDLTRFLGLDWHPPRLAHRANASPGDVPAPSARAIAQVRDHYAPVYAFCAARFGEDRIRRLWPHAAAVLDR